MNPECRIKNHSHRHTMLQSIQAREYTLTQLAMPSTVSRPTTYESPSSKGDAEFHLHTMPMAKHSPGHFTINAARSKDKVVHTGLRTLNHDNKSHLILRHGLPQSKSMQVCRIRSTIEITRSSSRPEPNKAQETSPSSRHRSPAINIRRNNRDRTQISAPSYSCRQHQSMITRRVTPNQSESINRFILP